MFRPALSLAALALATSVAASSAQAAPGGPLNTLPLGSYVCETGGDATGLAGIHQPEFDFTVTRASTYRIGANRHAGSGTYLMTSDRVTFTSGPREGMKFRQMRAGFLRQTAADGSEGALRCVRKPGSKT
jgi:hypothetical protein